MEPLSVILKSPASLILSALILWMLIHAVRNREWLWALFIVVFPVFGAFWYFVSVYRHSGGGSMTQGFELPGAHDRRRIKQLQAQIHHLDKAHHHSQLGDIYFQQGKLEKARLCYLAALERDPQDLDTRAHYGHCLLRLKQAEAARSWIEGVVTENPKHDYGYTMMALAETQTALGQLDEAVTTWRRVLDNHSYARARVQLAELLARQNKKNEARAEVTEVLMDDPHAPGFQRKRDRVWVRRAKRLLSQL